MDGRKGVIYLLPILIKLKRPIDKTTNISMNTQCMYDYNGKQIKHSYIAIRMNQWVLCSYAVTKSSRSSLAVQRRPEFLQTLQRNDHFVHSHFKYRKLVGQTKCLKELPVLRTSGGRHGRWFAVVIITNAEQEV